MKKTTAFARFKPCSKKKISAVKKSNYILRQGDYKNKEGLLDSGRGHLPIGFKDHRQFWEALDKNERANGVGFREIMIDLPDHMFTEHALYLADRISVKISRCFESKRLLAYEYAIHQDKWENKRHMHIMISERANDEIARDINTFFKRKNRKMPHLGGASKLENTSSARAKRMIKIKGIIQQEINELLIDIGMEDFVVDFERTRKLGKMPQIKLTPYEFIRMQKGESGKRIDKFRAIRRFNEKQDFLIEQRTLPSYQSHPSAAEEENNQTNYIFNYGRNFEP